MKGAATIKVQHEWHIFQEDYWDSACLQKSKYLSDQAGLGSSDASRFAGLTKVLARKSCTQHLRAFRQVRKLANVPVQRNVGEMVLEHGTCRRPVFT
jgi:hypothetical protein